MKTKVLIFDFDGTIADTFSRLIKIGNHLADEFKFRKVNIPEISTLQNKTPKEIIKYLNVPIFKIPLILRRLKKNLHKEITLIKPVEGIREVLIRLKSEGRVLGVLSSNSRENVTDFLKTHRLDFFDFIQTTSKIWNKNIRLKKLIKTHKFQKNDVIYIGDEKRDIAAAKKAGIKVAAVTWGFNPEKTLAVYNPDYLISHPQELLKL
ncbi:MAG: HAD-IA family hydrolase [Candidatus Omnitrophota bacterium]|nr:MAG: HAD-IA family hydrolase [Candidatus Omnitrophota bacterium]